MTAALGALAVSAAEPYKVGFNCEKEILTAAGMACSDDDRCPVYLELSGVAAIGKKISLAGNLHGPSATLSSVLLTSEDNGSTWKEPSARITGAALDQVQWLDAMHGWADGEEQIPLSRDPFFLITSDGGVSWSRKPLTEEGGVGAVQRFWFDSVDHGEIVVDAGRSAPGGRFVTYESHTGGDNWNVAGKTTAMPRLRRAPSLDEMDYRIGTDSKTHAFIVEKREGEKWNRVASFAVQVANCGSPMPAEPVNDAK